MRAGIPTGIPQGHLEIKGGIPQNPEVSPPSNQVTAKDTEGRGIPVTPKTGILVSFKIGDVVRLDKSKKPKVSKTDLATVWYITNIIGDQVHIASELVQGEKIFNADWLRVA